METMTRTKALKTIEQYALRSFMTMNGIDPLFSGQILLHVPHDLWQAAGLNLNRGAVTVRCAGDGRAPFRAWCLPTAEDFFKATEARGDECALYAQGPLT